jgi:Ca2+-transporting ATPase
MSNVEKGLSEKEAIKRLEKYGYNELEEKKTSSLKILFRQFTNFIVWVLIGAAVISLFIDEIINFFVIVAITCFIIFLGFIQEYKAEKAIHALKEIIMPETTAIRDGRIRKIPTREVVPEDILILEVGDKIPADAKVLEGSLKVDESALTGESKAVKKSEGELIFAGTTIVYGKCKALVTATGMRTKIGEIAGIIQEVEKKTPLQIKIEQLAKKLAVVAFIACTTVFAIGTLKGAPVTEILVVALALAVASVPEGLPLTLTLTLSLGMHRMARHKAIVRKMLGVEALGSVTVICTDKTGTITKNEMTVEKIFVNDKIFNVTGIGYELNGEFLFNGKKIDINDEEDLILLLKAAVLCNNASIGKEVIGDPTEIALAVAAAKADLWKDNLEKEYRRVKEIIFTPERKMMTTLHEKNSERIAFIKGAPEVVLQRCRYVQKNGKILKLEKEEMERILDVNKNLSNSALRVLGIAYKTASEDIEEDLIFLGLAGMIDPPREEVKDAIAACRNAGIKVAMITGDNPQTARAVAEKVNLTVNKFENDKLNDKLRRIVKDEIITGSELDELNDEELESVVEDIVIYARTMPEQKLKIVRALKNKGHVVAMTGDGVNDAPALKKADVGIAMGVKGTDVAKETSDMILQDDNFATIVEAVRQGRTIYDNIEKFTCYLISRNFTEVILILLGIVLLGFEFLPLLALQILFINTFDEIMPSIGLGLDSPGKGIMTRQPRKLGEKILKKRNLVLIVCVAVFMATASFFVFLSNATINIEKARTLTFATIISMILFVPFSFRSLDESIIKAGILTNRLLIVGVTCTFLLTLSVMYIPFLQKIFELATLSLKDWIIPLSVALITLFFVEFTKFMTKTMD